MADLMDVDASPVGNDVDEIMDIANEVEQETQNASLEEIMSKIKISTFGLKRNYSSIDISADKWLLTMDPKSLEKLSNPPSLADGLDREVEQVWYMGWVVRKIYFRNFLLFRLNLFAQFFGYLWWGASDFLAHFLRYRAWKQALSTKMLNIEFLFGLKNNWLRLFLALNFDFLGPSLSGMWADSSRVDFT